MVADADAVASQHFGMVHVGSAVPPRNLYRFQRLYRE